MHFEVLSTKYANINHFRLFFWKFCYKISLFWAFFLEFFGLGNNLALKAPHYTRTTTLILCITFHFWVRMSFFENAGGFAGTPSLAVGLFYTCILQGARQVQGPCCTNPRPNRCVYFKPQRVPNDTYGYHLSIDTFCFIVGWVVWS